jgi:hypothetical protein
LIRCTAEAIPRRRGRGNAGDLASRPPSLTLKLLA